MCGDVLLRREVSGLTVCADQVFLMWVGVLALGGDMDVKMKFKPAVHRSQVLRMYVSVLHISMMCLL